MKHGISVNAVGIIRRILADFPTVEKAVLYGSRAKGNFKPGSDIDLTLFGNGLNYEILGEIGSQIEESDIPYMVDLSIFDCLDNAELREHIDRVGVVFYERNCAGTIKHAKGNRDQQSTQKVTAELFDSLASPSANILPAAPCPLPTGPHR